MKSPRNSSPKKGESGKARVPEFAAAKAFLGGDKSQSVKSTANFSCRGSRVVGFGHIMRCPLRSTCDRVVEGGKPAPFVQRWSRTDVECSHYSGPTPTSIGSAEVIGDFS